MPVVEAALVQQRERERAECDQPDEGPVLHVRLMGDELGAEDSRDQHHAVDGERHPGRRARRPNKGVLSRAEGLRRCGASRVHDRLRTTREQGRGW